MRRVRPLASRAVVVAALAAVLAACAGSTTGAATPVIIPPGSIGPSRTVGPAVLLTRTTLAQALQAQGLQLQDTQDPFRPPEIAMFATAPRAIYQVVLPQDPGAGYLAVYEFLDPPTATQAANEMAAYLGSGPGRVNYPLAVKHVLRVVGPSVVLFSWNPDGVVDPGTPKIADALGTVGLGVDVPR